MYVLNKINDEKLLAEVSECPGSEVPKVKTSQFEFDWSKESNNHIIKLQLSKTKEIIGLMSLDIIVEELRVEISLLELSKENIGKNKKLDRIAGILIAYACKISFKMGFFGFVSLIPKTKLISHYESKYGFQKMGKQLAIDFERSERLIDKYLLDK